MCMYVGDGVESHSNGLECHSHDETKFRFKMFRAEGEGGCRGEFGCRLNRF